MLSKMQVVERFSVPVTKYPQIRGLQKQLLKSAVLDENAALASTRCLALMFDMDISALVFTAVEKVSMEGVSASAFQQVRTAQEIINSLRPFFNNIAFAIDEAKDFLPAPTAELLSDMNTQGYPMDRVAIAVLLVLAANLQES